MKRAEMQVNVAGIRRNIKNIAHNYSDAQKKVREATSNDSWGPSSTLMTEIADLTYNVVAFTEIMQMVWKRLNDHGRNWRHVYKALLLLEYLIKTGSEKVGQQCKENIFAINTLREFQYLEEGKDQGQNVREKARHLVMLLKDDDRLKSERARALKAKERFAQSTSGFGSDGGMDTPTSGNCPNYNDKFKSDWNTSRESADLPREIEVARPQTAGEEELQLQLALAMSREEAEQEEQKKRSDEVRLQLALSESQQDFKNHDKPGPILDLLDVSLDEAKAVDPWGMPQPPRPQNQFSSPWHGGGTGNNGLASPPPTNGTAASAAATGGGGGGGDPWAPGQAGAAAAVAPPVSWLPKPAGLIVDTAPPSSTNTSQRHDPWSPTSQSSTDLDEFDIISNRNKDERLLNNGDNSTSDPFELNLLGDLLPASGPSPSTGATKKTPHSFLGENSSLVNLDNLVTSKPSNLATQANPFSEGGHPTNHHLTNNTAPLPPPTLAPRPVFNPPPPKPSMNQIKQQTTFLDTQHNGGGHGGGLTSSPINTSGGGMMTGTTSPHFVHSSNGELFTLGGGYQQQQQQQQDPWAPVVTQSAVSPPPPQAATAAPWMKPGEPAVNPFLS